MKTSRDIFFNINDFVLCSLSDLSNAQSESIKIEKIKSEFCDLREMFSDNGTQIDLNEVLCGLRTKEYVSCDSENGWWLTKQGKEYLKTKPCLEANYERLKSQLYEINVNKSKFGQERKNLDPPKPTFRLHLDNGNK